MLYLAVVLIWGASWLAMKLQLGPVSAEASVAYRFAIAALIVFAWAAWRRLPLRFSLRDHFYIALQGAFICCFNFYFFYQATAYLTTGLIAVVMSTASIMTMFMNAILIRRRPENTVFVGALMGVGGIAIVFWPELAALSEQESGGLGLLLSFAGTFFFAGGSVISGRNQRAGLSVRGSMAWAMAYGALIMAVTVLISGKTFAVDTSITYLGSFFYLSFFASVLAFGFYFSLIARIGPERSAYVTVLFPLVALTLSTLFEGYQWSALAGVGVALTLLGNALVLWQGSKK